MFEIVSVPDFNDGEKPFTSTQYMNVPFSKSINDDVGSIHACTCAVISNTIRTSFAIPQLNTL